MSQLKVWKIVKERRDQKAAARMDEEQRRDQAELDLGRELEESNEQERATWEAVYGGQARGKAHQVDCEAGTEATASPRKASTSVNEADNIELISMRSAGNSETKAQQPAGVTVRVAEDSIYELPSATAENLLSTHSDNYAQSTTESLKDSSAGTQRKALSAISIVETAQSQKDTQLETLVGPSVVPLPFRVSSEDLMEEDDRSSIATFAASDHLPSRLSRRLSGSSLVRNLSRRSKRRSAVPMTAEEGLMIPHDDDQASSVAATLDDIDDGLSSEGGGLDSERQTPSLEFADKDTSSEPLISGDSMPLTFENLEGDHSQSLGRPTYIAGSFENVDDVGPILKDSENAGLERTVQEESGTPKSQDSLSSEPKRAPSTRSAATSQMTQGPAVPASFRDQLPEGASKVVMAYRTNEWAKHLEQAEAPPIEALQKPSSTRNASPIMIESAAPVHVKQLQQTALTGEPAPIRINTDLELRRSQQTYHDRSASSSRDSLPSQQHHEPPVPPRSSLRRSSQGKPINRTSPQSSLHHPRDVRRSSAPLTNSPFVESPIEEGVETSFPQRGGRTPSGILTNTLMAQRNRKLQNKYSNTSLARTSSSSSQDTGSLLDDQSSENLTLAQRRSLLQGQPRHSSRSNLIPRTSATYLTHQPPSGPSAPGENTESMVSAWRTSLRNDSSANVLSQQQMDARRDELLNQKRRASAGAQAAGAERSSRESQRDWGLRRGDMMERHKEAMRKMQAGVDL